MTTNSPSGAGVPNNLKEFNFFLDRPKLSFMLWSPLPRYSLLGQVREEVATVRESGDVSPVTITGSQESSEVFDATGLVIADGPIQN